ncbi:MAG: RNA methyltransferase [Chloroflexi bacterium]|nr:RNA methyltransferase [Chloroflexota bacterium]MBP8054561.1 RNA methyltransferase [Chloroflexota bacterium]
MITSFSNPLIKQIKQLRHKKERQMTGRFFAEGLRVVMSALEAQAPVESVVYAPELLKSEAAWQMIRAREQAGGSVVPVAAAVFQSFSDRDNATGLGAIIHIQPHTLDQLPISSQSIFVLLDRVADPGNLGTVLRSLDAVGANGLILTGESTDPYHPTAVKASMGTLFTLPLVQLPGIEPVWVWAQTHQIHTIATSAKASQEYWKSPYQFPVLLLMGNEQEGLSQMVQDAAASRITIPMFGQASSLNLGVATSLLLYELRRRLNVPGQIPPTL